MVGLVLVSHSRDLARGLADLVSQVAGEVPIVAVGGTEDGRLGTDATAVMAAIEQVKGEDGVLIFVDLGSSVMSAETALELLGPEAAAGVEITGAPMVEGAVTAGVESRLGRSLAEVRAAAEAALTVSKI